MLVEEELRWLKQAPRKFDSFLIDQGYHKTQDNHCVFVKKLNGGDFLILMLYVDDMLIVEQDRIKITILKKALSRSFSMKDMGPMREIMGMHIV